MIRKIIFILLLLKYFSLNAQNTGDTITTQTFDYSSTTRDSVFNFPSNNSITYEKIIMSYNMRCKDDVINTSGSINNIGCGAWDYSCHTNIHDSSRVDSIKAKTTSHVISNFTGNAYSYSTSPIYNYYQFLQHNTILNSIINEDTTLLGTGNNQLDIVLATDQNSNKSQFLYKADELAFSGLINDSIHALSLNSISTNTLNFFKIKLKLTSDSILNPLNPHLDGFTEVYHSNTVLNSGENRFQFFAPFMWDSTSNIIVEFSLSNSSLSSPSLILGD